MKKILINNQSGKRIDKFLKEEVFLDMEITRGEIIRQIKNGKVLANNKIIKPSYMLKENDKIEIDFDYSNKKELELNSDLDISIIYEDENIIVLDKPAGIQVHPDVNEKKNTLVNFLLYKYPEIKNVHDDSHGSDFRPGIVHRLDKDTSGVIIVAKNKKTYLELKRKFREREIEKKYWVIVYGEMEDDEGVIEKPIARASNYKKQVIAGEKTKTKIREAKTYYKVIKKFNNYSLIEAAPKTGRMHQIRIHLSSVGHPVVGDKLYFFRNTKDKLGAKRQLLHAKKIKFELFGEEKTFESEIPDDFGDFLSKLDEQK